MMKFLFTGVLTDFTLTKNKTELQMSIDAEHDTLFSIDGMADFALIQAFLGQQCTVVGVLDMLHPADMIIAEKILTVDDQKMSIQELLGTNVVSDEGDKATETGKQPEQPITYTANKSAPSVESLLAGAKLNEIGQGVDVKKIQQNLDSVAVPTAVSPVVVTAEEMATGKKAVEEKKRIVWNAQGDQVEETMTHTDQSSTAEEPENSLADLPMD